LSYAGITVGLAIFASGLFSTDIFPLFRLSEASKALHERKRKIKVALIISLVAFLCSCILTSLDMGKVVDFNISSLSSHGNISSWVDSAVLVASSLSCGVGALYYIMLGCTYPFFFGIVRNKCIGQTRVIDGLRRTLSVLVWIEKITLVLLVSILYLSSFHDLGGRSAVTLVLVFYRSLLLTFRRTQKAMKVFILAAVWQFLLLTYTPPSAAPFPIFSALLPDSMLLRAYLIAIVVDIIEETFQKLKFVLIAIVSAWRIPSQRRPNIKLLIGMEVAMFPFVVALVTISSILAVPILPVFGLPLFLLSPIRPKRIWPSLAKAQSEGEESAYYKAMLPGLRHKLGTLINSGGLGDVREGSFFLCRYDRFLVIFEVMEVGFAHALLLAKGMELAETSCHTLEATDVDNVFLDGFGRGTTRNRMVNSHWLHCLQPLSSMTVPCYSLSSMQLVGVMDDPDLLASIPRTFLKCLVPVLCSQAERDSQQETAGDWVVKGESKYGKFSSLGDELFPDEIFASLSFSLSTDQRANIRVVVLSIFHAIFDGYDDLDDRGKKGRIVDVFGAVIQPSVLATDLFQCKDIQGRFGGRLLLSLSVSALRIALKLSIDDLLIGGFAEDGDGWLDRVEKAQKNMFIGSEGTSWVDAIERKKEVLFALRRGVDGDSINAKTATWTDNEVMVGSLLGSAVEGQWASLLFELVYLTNDDEERYSIQSHPPLLRNLTVQAAEPPLGYAPFSALFSTSL